MAGPGAGKTELLAQKACFLLQTNTCPFPKKILAISFKRDAAYNLKERVNRRCPEALARRFDSYTFDAFAKQLLDRFHSALPNDYKIQGDYSIFFEKAIVENAYRSIDETYYNTTDMKWEKYLTASALPLARRDRAETFRYSAWESLTKRTKCLLNFPMIMRLAEFIMNANPKLRSFLQQTYSHVFLDEFQDTTQLQYDFLNSCFLTSEVNYTAVGDDKQRIMGWAGAVIKIFDIYKADKKAIQTNLVMNFRSAPKLVELQNHLVKELLNKSEVAQASSKWKADQGEAFLYFFSDPEQEMEVLLEKVKEWIKSDRIFRRDICILVKSSLSVYAERLIDYFKENGISARDESIYQDFLTEEAIIFIIAFIRIIFDAGSTDYGEIVFNFLANINSCLLDEQLLKLRVQLSEFVKSMRKKYKNNFDRNSVPELVKAIGLFTGAGKIRNAYPQYRQGGFLRELVKKLLENIQREYDIVGNIQAALDLVEGKDSIPVMTIHKSKGLEYHTVIFVGLEDGAFWSFKSQADEDKNAFFVALSRAKERIIFTFCNVRENRFGKTVDNSFSNIRIIFEKIQSSGIVEFIDYSES